MTARIAPQPDRAVVAVTGPDARTFLHGLLSQDALSLEPGQVRFGALLSPPGRLLFDLFLWGDDDGVRLDVAAARRDALITRLTMHRLRAQVAILLNGIDFQKGCFIGQETTSRKKRRGTLKTRMLPLAFDGPLPPPGTEVLAGDLRAGEVLTGRDGTAIGLMRLDRIAGPLTADGRPLQVERPEWMGDALAPPPPPP